MQETLVIYLHTENPEQPSWAVIDALGNLQHCEEHNNAEDLFTFATDREVIVAVPAEDVLLTTVTLPKMNRSKLMHALPYALEEQLIDEVETLHFAPFDFRANGELAIAIVSKEKMDHWFSLIKAWQINPDRMLPANLMLPWQEKGWGISVKELALVRTGFASGFSCDKDNLNELLNLQPKENGFPETVSIMNYTATPVANQLALPLVIKETLLPATSFMVDMARGISSAPSFNLLQGPYAVKKSKLPRTERLGKIAVFLLAALVSILFLYPMVSCFILQQRVKAIDNDITQIYKHNFPQSTSVVAPKLRMEEKLRKLSAQIGENRFLLLLGNLGQAMTDAKNIQLKRVDYQSSQLTLEMTAASSEDFTAFTNALMQQGLDVKQQNANLVGARVNATLLIE